MFCLGERDTLLVTYISGSLSLSLSLFFKDTLLRREGPARGAFQKGRRRNSSRLKIGSQGVWPVLARLSAFV